MADSNAKIIDLINRTRGAGTATPAASDTSAFRATETYTPSNLLTENATDPGIKLAQDVAQGGLNAIGYTFRVLTGLGRAVTNATYTNMEHSNNAWKAFDEINKKGFTVDRYLKGLGAGLTAIPDTAWGGFKGLATSVIPEFGDMVKPLDSRPIMEAGQDLFMSKEFKKTSDVFPALKPLSDNKTKLGRLNIPFTDIGTDVTPAGLSGFGWDVLTDPASFATLGVGGAVRGAGRAISATAKYGKVKELADVPSAALPRPFYSEPVKVEGKFLPKRVGNQVPNQAIPYNVVNTSAPLYVLKEMGRGFQEAHQRAFQIAAQASARRKVAGTVFTRLAEKLLGKERTEVEGFTETVFDDFKDAILEQTRQDLAKRNVTDPQAVQEAEADALQALQDMARTIAANPEGVSAVTGRQTLDSLRAQAEANGTNLVDESAQVLANRYATTLPSRARIIQERKSTDVNLEQVDTLARQGFDAADPNIEGGDFASAWDSFKEQAGQATYKRALKQLVMPLGYREKAFKQALEASGEDPKAGNVIKAAFGLNISPKARGRKADPDFEMVTERVAGKISRTKAVRKLTGEQKFLQGQEKALATRFSGKPGSQNALLTGGPRKRIWTDQEAEDAWKKITEHLAKLGVTNDEDITGQMLIDAGVSPSLMSARLSYILNQESVASRDLTLIRNVVDGEYNPFTAQAENIKSNQFSVTAAERKEAESRLGATTLREFTKKLITASGRINDERLFEILEKLGIERRTIQNMMEIRNSNSFPTNKIVEVLTNAKIQTEQVARINMVRELLRKEYKAAGTKIAAKDLLAEAEEALEEGKFAEVTQNLTPLVKKGALASQAELDEAVEILSTMFERQVAAREDLTRLGFDVDSPAGNLLYAAVTALGAPGKRVKRATTTDKGMADLAEAIGKGTKLPKDVIEITREEAFIGPIKALQTLAKQPNLDLTVREAISKIDQIFRTLPPKKFDAKAIREVYARIGNITKQLGEQVTFEDSGFNLAFRQEAGEIAVNRIPDFIMYAYRSSRAKDSLDAGYYADFIDDLLKKQGLPSLDAVKKADQLTAATALKNTWRGEGITVPLLQDLMSDTQHKGSFRYAETTAKEGAATFLKNMERDAVRFETELRETAIRNIIEDENAVENLIKANETQFATMKTQEYGNMEAPFGETAEEIDLVRSTIEKDRLTLNEDTIRLMGEYARLGGDLRLFKVTRDGKPVAGNLASVQPGDVLDHRQFSKIAFKFPQFLEEQAGIPKGDNALRLNQLAGQFYFRGLRQGYKKAAGKLARYRAETIVNKIFPSYAKADEVIRVAKKTLSTNPNGARQVAVGMRSRYWLADMLMKTDRAISQYDLSNTVTQRIKGYSRSADGLIKQREEFDKLLNKVDAQLETSGVQRGLVEVTDMTLQDALETGNPRLFIDFIRNFKVVSQKDRDDWKTAMSHLRNMTKIQKGGAYDDYSELIESYRTNTKQLLAGEINPVTGRPVPSAEQVINLLTIRRGDEYIFGEKVGQKATLALEAGMPDRKTILRWLKPIQPGTIGDELQQARRNDFIAATQTVNGNTVRRAADALEDPQVVAIQFQEHLNSELARLEKEGLSDVVTLAALAAGVSARKFFVEGAQYQHPFTDSLFRKMRADKPSVKGERTKRNVVKSNFDKETNYEGFKAVLQNLSAMAERKGYKLGDPLRQDYVASMMVRVLRLRDLYFYNRGVFPSTSADLKAQEGSILGLFKDGVTNEQKRQAGKAVFLSEADVLDVLGIKMTGDLFAIGPVNSMPITSLLPPARFLVQALDSIPTSRYFNEQELVDVADTMYALMINHIKKQTKNSKDGTYNAFNVDPEATYERIRIVISELMRPENATKLYDQHTYNAMYAEKLLKYEAGNVSKPVMDAWLRMMDNPQASAGMKIEETIKATEELRTLLGQDIDENIKLMLEMDAKVIMAGKLDPDSLVLANEAEAMVETAEMAGIRAVQQGNQNRIDADTMRDPLHQNITGLQMKAAEGEINAHEDIKFDIANDAMANRQERNWALKFGYESFSRLFSAFGMEDVRPFYEPIERIRVEATGRFEQEGIKLAQKWRQQAPDRDIMAEAWNVITNIPEEVLVKATNARETLYALMDKRMKGEPGLLNVEALDVLQQESDLFEPFLTMDDELLNKAVIDLWKLSSPIIGGGKYSLMLRTGLNPQYLNRNIRELGLGITRGAIDENGIFTKTRDAYGFPPNSKSIEDVSQAWRDWDITKPVDMLVGLHTALQQAGKVPEMAVAVNRAFGVPKTEFVSAAAAKKAGYVEMKSISFPSEGKELLYFMQSEGFYYPLEIAQQLGTFSKFVTEMKYLQGKGAVEKGLKALQSTQNFAKQQMTLFTPKNWVQNTIGGYWTNWMAGVNNPVTASVRATKMLQTRGIDLDSLGLDLDAMDRSLGEFFAEQGKTGRVVKAGNDPRGEGMLISVKSKFGQVSWADLGNIADKLGLFPPVAQSRDLDLLGEAGKLVDIGGNKKITKKIADKYGKVSYKLGHWASLRDAWLRSQLFLDVLAKGNWNSLEEGAREAMKTVDRYHPQLQGLSTFNQKYTRNFVMFFTWRAKTLGWVMMDLLDKPGRILTPLKAQYNLQRSNEETEPKAFGDFTPANVPMPWFNQKNLDPIAQSESTGALYKFSVANPVTDLLGSTGWLSGIDFNNYEPVQDQLISMTLDTWKRFALSSEPLLISALDDWSKGKTMNGTQMGVNGWNSARDNTLLIEDALKRVGLGPYHTMVAAMFPDLFLKASWSGESQEFIGQEGFKQFFNWLDGIKLNQIDKVEDRQKGLKEVLDKLKTLQQ